MPLKYGNSELSAVIWKDKNNPNGVYLDRVVFNGVTIWENSYFVFNYLDWSDSYSVTSAAGKEAPSSLVIPSTYNNKAVTGISNSNAVEVNSFSSKNITSITIPDSITWIGRHTFNNCSITNLIIPDSVTEIGDGFAQDCSNLDWVVLPASLSTFGNYTFYDSSTKGYNLNKVYFKGTEEQWSNFVLKIVDISTNQWATVINGVPHYYYSAEHPQEKIPEDYPYWRYENGVPTLIQHHYTSTTIQPTCTSEGKTTYTCSDCGFSYTDTLPARGHAYTVEEIEATCTVQAHKKYTCSRCNHSYTDGYSGSLLPHTWIDATCDTAKTCSVCGTTEGLPLGHDWFDPVYTWTGYTACSATRACKRNLRHSETATLVSITSEITKQPTETQEGERTYTATFDKDWAYDQKIEPIPMLNHVHEWGDTEYDWADDYSTCVATRTCKLNSNHIETATGEVTDTVTFAPTCTQDGTRMFTAKFANDKDWAERQDVNVVEPATGHSWNEPTYSWAGYSVCVATRTCKTDPNHQETTTTDSIISVETEAATCTTNGVMTYIPRFAEAWAQDGIANGTTTAPIYATGHKWSVSYEWSSDYKKCTATRACGNDSSHDLTETVDTTAVITTSPTCTTKGWTTYTAKFTADWASKQTEEVQNVAIVSTAHSWNEPNYSGDGISGYYATRTCKNSSSHIETAEAKITSTVLVNPTCESDGTRSYTANFTETWAKDKTTTGPEPATGHKWNSPTYEWAGYSVCVAYRTCKNDSSHKETATSNSVNDVVTKAATCTTNGTMTYTPHFKESWAEAENANGTTTAPIYATGHTFGDWYETKAPTESAKGEKRRDCSVCDAYETATIPALGHSHDNWDKIILAAVAPTCTATGLTEGSKCSGCDEILVAQTVVPALGHKYNSVVTNPTCTTDGYTTYTCSVCNATYTDNFVPAIGDDWKEPTYSWNSTNSTCTATRICKNDSSHNEQETVNTTAVITTSPTCTTKGTTTYTATFTKSWASKQTKSVQNVAIVSTAHSWNEPNYSGDGISGYYATRTCKNSSSHIETATAKITSSILVNPTCTQDGTRSYTANFTETWATDKTTTGPEPATGHSWNDPTYAWAGYSACVATRTCKTDQNHKETATTYTIISAETKAATCTTDGTMTYTAHFTESWADAGIAQTSATIPATGHSWNDPTYSWSSDYKTCTATRTCANANHPETETVNTTAVITTSPTCTTKGTTTYTATFTKSWASKQTKAVQNVNIVSTAHSWNSPSYTWDGTNSTCTATRICKNDSSHNEQESVNTTSQVTTNPTCTATGIRTFYANFTKSWATDQTKDVTEPKLGHNWDTVTYSWSNDNSKCTATRACKNDTTHPESETVNSTSTVTKAATCTTAGNRRYTADFTKSWATDQTKDVTINATGHNWDSPTYVWDGTNSSCTATRTCKNDSSHNEQEAVNTTNSVKTAATCTATGVRTYKADFTKSWATDQTKDVTIPATGHSWDTVSYSWNSDYSKCTAVRACKNDSTHPESETVNTTSSVKTAATCTATGVRTYKADFTKSWATDQTKDVQNIPATGHNWEVTYTWDGTNSTCTATRTCKNDSSHKEQETVSTTSSVTKAATCTATGVRTYKADFTKSWATDQTKDVTIPATGHSWKTTTYVWSSDNSKCTASRVCNNANHPESSTVNTTNSVTKAATCTAKGTRRYTADFTVDWATDQTKDVDIPATGHSWNDPNYTWTGYTACTATRTCQNNLSHSETSTATITSKITTPIDCLTPGVRTYTATFSDSWATTQTKTESIPAPGQHVWLPTIVYTWADDGSSCTATRTCSANFNHIETATAAITSSVSGTTKTYTATFSVSWATTQTKSVEVEEDTSTA